MKTIFQFLIEEAAFRKSPGPVFDSDVNLQRQDAEQIASSLFVLNF